MALSVYVSGLLFSFSLIVAIGAQNAFVLRQAVLRCHVATIVVICAGSDVLLIAAGVAGIGAAVADRPTLLTGARVGGAVLLVGYAALAARRAIQRGGGSEIDGARAASRSGLTRRRAAATAAAFTWLNPAVYLDTLVLLGTVSNARPSGRWWFAAGAATASVLWFVALGAAASIVGPLLRRRVAWRLLDASVAVVMVLTALRTLPL